MAKPQEAEKNSAKKPRVGVRTLGEIERYAEVIAGQSGLFGSILKEMKASKIQEIEFDGINKMDRAIVLVNDFIDAMDIAVRRAKRDRSV